MRANGFRRIITTPLAPGVSALRPQPPANRLHPLRGLRQKPLRTWQLLKIARYFFHRSSKNPASTTLPGARLLTGVLMSISAQSGSLEICRALFR